MNDNTLDMDSLLHALDNENNSSIGDLTTEKIQTYKNNALQQLQLPREMLKQYHKKLKNYRLVEDLPDVQYGHHIRWILLKDPNNIKLTNGGIICDIRVFNQQVHIRCKNNLNRIMQIILDECLVFQKLSDQERVILDVLDYLATKS